MNPVANLTERIEAAARADLKAALRELNATLGKSVAERLQDMQLRTFVCQLLMLHECRRQLTEAMGGAVDDGAQWLLFRTLFDESMFDPAPDAVRKLVNLKWEAEA